MNKNTAKNGYKEENLICNDLNSNIKLQEKFKKFTNTIDLKLFSKNNGQFKTDIHSSDLKFKLQVKKYKNKQFGQVDRHWIDDFIFNINGLKDIQYMLKNLCEMPLKDCGKLVDKNKGRKLLNLNNYNNNELINLINYLNKYKKNILEYVFKGTDLKNQPNYICGVEYIKNKRSIIIIYNLDDVIDYLLQFDFFIKKSNSVISLNNCFSIQRKGGDSGKKSSNQIQFKLIFSELNITNKLEFIL